MDIGKQIGLTYGAATRDAFGKALREIGHENSNLVVLDGDVANSTRTEYFAQDFPERFFNVGIAESNLIGVASGLAMSGKDVVAASFAAFLLCNAYDQIRMSIAFPQVPVKLVGSHSGISIGEDGPSQMAIEDVALATSLPGFTVLVPADEPSTRAATRAMMDYDGPVYLRTGRPKVPVVYPNGAEFRIGKANTLREGSDLTIIACGLMVAVALEAAGALAREGIEARVLDMHTVKPLDEPAVERAARETGAIVTAEEHLLDGGLGAAVARAAAERHPVPMAFVGIRDRYAESGKPQELLEKHGLMPNHVVDAARRVLKIRSEAPARHG
ncbi:MAG: transketolase C-terminal domain-containing protein [Anaerolineae bacterium]|nr:transketolase C-terminal domain-containing protein [Anaerolineae bacterium]MDX9830699.1 transketolase C-terminal domain-containing protein [Anaerolineae bacterium]